MDPPLYPPHAWFDDPRLSGPTPLTVDDDGRVYGHLATWNTCHTGFPGQCVTPPHSSAGYPYFHTGVAETADGTQVPVGRITMRTGHAALRAADGRDLTAADAMAHYDHTGFAVAVVRAGDDRFGIWHAGSLLPHVTEIDVAEFRRHPPSGDWRVIGGRHELIHTLQVNAPGFPVLRARVASGGVVALVASVFAPRVDAASEAAGLLARVDQAAALRGLAARISQ